MAMTDDKAMKCAEEIVDIFEMHGIGPVRTIAAIIRKHYPSSWTRIEKDKAETLPPMNVCEVRIRLRDGSELNEAIHQFDGTWWWWERFFDDSEVTHWQFLPAAPEEK